MQVNGTQAQTSFPIVDAIAGPPLAVATDDPSRLLATPSLAELHPAVDQKSVDEKALAERVKQANEGLKAGDEHLHFTVHKGAEGTKVRLVDRSDETVMREFEPHRFLDMIDKLQNVSGLQINVQG